MRIELVTQMWPSRENPDLGSFLVPLTAELEVARRFRPDVVFAHFLFPAGAAGVAASMAGRCPLVVMAHGTDVANLGEIRGVRTATARVISRSAAVIANSGWLAERLAAAIPEAAAKTEIADCGIDLEAFTPADAAPAREELGWGGEGPAFLCVGSLIERKNVTGLADAFAALGRGRLAFVGDGPLRPRLEGRPGVRVVGRIPQREVPRWVAACDVLCQPSLIEPFGQATLEGMAMERTVVATTNGGPPEFVPPQAGVLVDPDDPAALRDGLERAAAMPSPNPAAREAAALHDVRSETATMLAVLQRAVADARPRGAGDD
ncbi:MAG: glycosyltransferase family 4 protein [Acidobacteria bacterium]|nr:MAG: glycosyltransferase family 4 protein [Acidobacteriota bacterium]